jgi:hypothetical protein
MNEQLPIPLPSRQHTTLLPERAQRIRDLARTCIIEIGRELIAAKAEVAHGEWLSWLEEEFGWSDDTARNYMRVAEVFQIPNSSGFDVTALYVLAAPGVPQEVRDEAIERAEAGERITKADADMMITDAVSKAIAAEREVVALTLQEKEREAEELRQRMGQIAVEAQASTADDLAEATKTLTDLQAAYETVIGERDAARDELTQPSEERIVRLVMMLGKKRKASRLMLVAIASALGHEISFNGKTYSPVAEDDLTEMRRRKAIADEKLRQLFNPKGPPAHWHKALMALRVINELSPVEILMTQRYTGFDHVFATELPKAQRWIDDFAGRMRDVGNTKPNRSGGSSINHLSHQSKTKKRGTERSVRHV